MIKPRPLTLAISLLCTVASLASAQEPAGTTLKDFFTAAINYSPNLKAAEENMHIGDARIDYANGQLLPQLNADSNISTNSSKLPGYPLSQQDYYGRRYSVQLSQVLFNWQAFTSRQQAYLQSHQYEAQYYAQLAQLLTSIADNYLTVLQSEDALSSMKSELEAVTNQANAIQQMYNRQLAKITDLYLVQAQQAAAQSQLVSAESDVQINKEVLHSGSGLDVGSLHRLPKEITVTPLTEPLDTWLTRARNNNKQIEASNYALEAADKAVSQSKGAYLPKVSLVLQAESTDVGYSNTRVQRSITNYVGVDFSIPLFAGGSSRALVHQAQGQRNIAEDQVKQTTLDVLDRVRNAYYKTRSGEARIAAAKLLAESTATSYTAMKRGFELGTVTNVDVLNALRDQFHAQRDLQQARYDHIRYMLVLQREAGTLSPTDLEQVSEQLNAAPLSP